MSLFGSPAPQWTDLGTVVASAPARLVLAQDVSGAWVLLDSPNVPEGAFIFDPAGSGATVIDSTVTVGFRPALLPVGSVILY